MSIGSFVFVFIVAFVLSSGVETPMQDGKMLSALGSRLVEAGIRTFYLLTNPNFWHTIKIRSIYF